jgi:hypothetical protein
MKVTSFGDNTYTFMVGEEPIDEDEETPTLEIFFKNNVPFSAMLDGIPINLDVTLFNLNARTD